MQISGDISIICCRKYCYLILQQTSCLLTNWCYTLKNCKGVILEPKKLCARTAKDKVRTFFLHREQTSRHTAWWYVITATHGHPPHQRHHKYAIGLSGIRKGWGTGWGMGFRCPHSFGEIKCKHFHTGLLWGWGITPIELAHSCRSRKYICIA